MALDRFNQGSGVARQRREHRRDSPRGLVLHVPPTIHRLLMKGLRRRDNGQSQSRKLVLDQRRMQRRGSRRPEFATTAVTLMSYSGAGEASHEKTYPYGGVCTVWGRTEESSMAMFVVCERRFACGQLLEPLAETGGGRSQALRIQRVSMGRRKSPRQNAPLDTPTHCLRPSTARSAGNSYV
jgi:hypothetical protein